MFMAAGVLFGGALRVKGEVAGGLAAGEFPREGQHRELHESLRSCTCQQREVTSQE